MLRDSLHQPQYVEKLEKILRFVIKEKALTMQDLDNIWAAQVIFNWLTIETVESAYLSSCAIFKKYFHTVYFTVKTLLLCKNKIIFEKVF